MKRKIFRYAVIVAVTLFLGVATNVNGGSDQYLTVHKLPDFQPALDGSGAVLYMDVASLEKEFRRQSPALKKFYHSRKINRIVIPSEEWLFTALNVSREFFLDVGMEWKQESWDCDNFSMLFSSTTTIKLWAAGFTDTRCGLGWMIVNGKHTWGDIKPGNHALVFAVTRQGIMVIEPQNGTRVELDRYPNKQFIEKVFLL